MFLMKNNPVGINFEADILQWIKDQKKVGESQSKAVNRLLKVAMNCNSLDVSIIKKLYLSLDKAVNIIRVDTTPEEDKRIVELL